jgi:hypothetical protein
MRIRTRDLPNSFSSRNKKQKAVLLESVPRASVFGKADLSESIDQSAVRSNYEGVARLVEISD